MIQLESTNELLPVTYFCLISTYKLKLKNAVNKQQQRALHETEKLLSCDTTAISHSISETLPLKFLFESLVFLTCWCMNLKFSDTKIQY